MTETQTACDCGECHECDIRGVGKPRPDTRTVAEVLAATDPHARPARRPRGAKADPAPGLFDTPERSDS